MYEYDEFIIETESLLIRGSIILLCLLPFTHTTAFVNNAGLINKHVSIEYRGNSDTSDDTNITNHDFVALLIHFLSELPSLYFCICVSREIW